MVPAGVALENALLYAEQSKSLEKEQLIRKELVKCVAPELVEHIVVEGKTVETLQGERAQRSILFGDIRDFTTISEKIGEATLPLLNTFLTEITDVITGDEVIIDKYIGDAIMLRFTTPGTAVATAIKMKHAAFGFNNRTLPELIAKNPWNSSKLSSIRELRLGLGLATGIIDQGIMGNPAKRIDYTVIGDPANTASRLEGLTKFYGSPIIIDDHTIALLPLEEQQAFVLRKIDRVRVKGKKEPIDILEEFSVIPPNNLSIKCVRVQSSLRLSSFT